MKPSRLKAGDEIRVIAPSRSLAIVKGEQRRLAEERLMELGFKVTYGNTALVHDDFFSNSIEDRIEDLHDAFRDPNVKGIFTAIGGYNANQLLRYIDYDLIKENPKVLMGYSDVTAILLAIYKKTGLTTYPGPHFSTFGMKAGLEYTMEYFKKAVLQVEDFYLEPSETWSDDSWHLEQDDRTFHTNSGYMVIQEGEATGTIIGGNLCTINLLQGTEYMPSLKDSILFIEDDEESHPFSFDRDLQSLLQLPDASGIKGIVIGRFQKESGMTDYALQEIIATKKEINGIPVIANANFGHVHPFVTVPVGAKAVMNVKNGKVTVNVLS
ncbi:S66 peptidase family protein [Peribacillus butanolivorans]|uniref:S66 family peptidase n=1 Tax=Peribacillus butanolivorans TaxID=421767 RepID=UPI0006A72783|nr:S66 peptidase family protein [Peribacillus butanolivorans]KON69725.1 peptidase S66 [Peribacillus butanolivorans]KRF64453.1 peptidase S66 [Bacillus sp. Soil768D1]MCO0599314.1 LD-carboxypeptidase [Peribacillus butanolivorans]MED3692159.1 LD-carboxypeptidase [Peribacillus butanolivorans]